MLKKLLIIALLVGLPFTSGAAVLSTEVGKGVKIGAYDDNDYQNSAIVLKIPTGKYTFLEHRLGLLAKEVTTSIAFGLESRGDFRVHGSIGGAYLNVVPKELTGHAQFIISLGASYQWKHFVFSVNGRHLSNGSRIFNHGRRPNDGVEHIMLGLGIEF